MKWILTCLLLAGCCDNTPNSNTTKYHTDGAGYRYFLENIDGCEYIVGSGQFATHKGNCTNVIHLRP